MVYFKNFTKLPRKGIAVVWSCPGVVDSAMLDTENVPIHSNNKSLPNQTLNLHTNTKQSKPTQQNTHSARMFLRYSYDTI